VLRICSADDEAYPALSRLVLGAILMSQGSSIRRISLHVDAAAITGADSAIFVSLLHTYWLHEGLTSDLSATCAGSKSHPPSPDSSRTILIVSVSLAQGACTALRDLVVSTISGFEQRGMTLFQVSQC